MVNNTLNITNETELHYKVVDYIRNYISEEAIIIPGLGEYQINSSIRTDAYKRGYKGGQPDLILLNKHNNYKGLAIELKTPTGLGVISDKQKNYINSLDNNGFLTLISNNYDEIITTIIKYSMGLEYNSHPQEIKKDDCENYYRVHCDSMKRSMRKYASKTTLCDCGKVYQLGNKHHHLHSSKHLKWVEENL